MSSPNPFDTPAPVAAAHNPFDTPAKKATPTPAKRNPFDAPAPSTNPFAAVVSGLGTALESTPAAPAIHLAKQLAGPVGWATNVQLDTTREMTYHGGSPDENRARARAALGDVETYYKVAGTIPGVGHAVQGAMDVGLDTLQDPLTAETLMVGAVPKTLAKVGAAGMKAMSGTMPGRIIYDATHWGGKVARTEGVETLQTVRGGLNLGSETGAQVTKKFESYTKRIINGVDLKTGKKMPGAKLTDEEQKHVYQALNGEIPTPLEAPTTFTPKEALAYKRLRGLSDYDYRIRHQAALSNGLRELGTGLSTEDRATLAKALREGKEPVIPKPTKRVKKPYGEPQPRSRAVPGQESVDLKTVFDKQMEGLVEEDASALRKAWQTDPTGAKPPPAFPGAISPDLKVRLQTLQKGNRGSFGVGAFEHQELKPKPRYNFQPGNQAAIDHATMLNEKYHQIAGNVEKAVPRRENYMPFAHRLDETKGRPARTIDTGEHYDPRAQERPDLPVQSAAQGREGFAAMAKNVGRQVKTDVVHKALGDLMDHPEIKKLFESTIRATGAYRTDVEKAQDAWLKVVGYPRAATVSLFPRHGANILDLAANTVPLEKQPQFFKDVTALTVKILAAKTEREYAALTQAGREGGALSGEFRERQPFFQKFSAKIPENVPFTDWKMPKAVAGKSLIGPLEGKSTGPLGAWTRMNNRLVWAIDTAAKQTYMKIIAESGEATGLRAGALASERLVDYAHRSPLTDVLRHVAPFGTFRGSIPGAVMGGIARNPVRAAAWNRATGGLMYGGKPQPGQHGLEAYGPTEDVSRGIEAPQEYLRATLGAPIQAAGTLGLEALAGKPGQSIKDTASEIAALPRQVSKGQWKQIGTPPKPSKYADAVKMRVARYLNYGNAIDLRSLLSAASAGVLEARAAP